MFFPSVLFILSGSAFILGTDEAQTCHPDHHWPTTKLVRAAECSPRLLRVLLRMSRVFSANLHLRVDSTGYQGGPANSAIL